jgi:uncharacterized protein
MLQTALKEAMRAKEQSAVRTIRLILAALKDRDIAQREKGVMDGIGDGEILTMLQGMIKQRGDSIALYEKGGRQDLVEQEQQEILVINRFLPKALSEAEMLTAIVQIITTLEATSIKEMGAVMARLKADYAGQMDFAQASALVKAKLTQ